MLPVEHFNRFRAELLALPMRPDGYTRAELINNRFHLFSARGLDVYYAPFHYLSRSTRVLLIGLTPGWTQMERAFRAAKIGLENGLDGEALFHYIDVSGSFSGPMRSSLVSMLDGIGLHDRLRVRSCNDCFDPEKPDQHLAGFTSVISAPIFKNGDNYRGLGPRLLQVPVLRQWALDNLARELASVPEAIVVPLGQVANEVIQFLSEQGPHLVRPDRCLMGFPHPSRANGHRKRIFEQGCKRWIQQLAHRSTQL